MALNSSYFLRHTFCVMSEKGFSLFTYDCPIDWQMFLIMPDTHTLSCTICTVLYVSEAALTLFHMAAAFVLMVSMLDLFSPNWRPNSMFDLLASTRSRILIFSCNVNTFRFLLCLAGSTLVFLFRSHYH